MKNGPRSWSMRVGCRVKRQKRLRCTVCVPMQRRSEMLVVLRPYQREALAAIEDASQRGIQRQLVVMPTGTGKTLTFAVLIAQRHVPTLILVHREELALQTVEKMAMIAQEIRCGIVKATRNDLDAPVVIASVQTVQRVARLAPILPRQ